MALFAVEYAYSDATAADRDVHRPTHRAWLGGLVEKGVVVSSGPYPDGTGALILVRADTLEVVERHLANDPFHKADLIEAVRINEWKPVLGAFVD